MELGKHLRELFGIRFAFLVCFLLAALAGVWASYKLPSFQPRSLQIASATAEVLVDTPYSSAVDLRQGESNFDDMTSRAVLLGNVIASAPVLDYIAQQAHLPSGTIRAQAPLTPDFPRPITQPGQERSAKDIARSPDEYRINVQVDPSVPVMRIYAQAPDARSAQTLATASIAGLQHYLDSVATREATPNADRIRLDRLGSTPGVVINRGVRLQASILAFFIVFGLAAAVAVFISRLRRGWNEAGEARDPTAAPALPLVHHAADGPHV